MNDVVSLLKQLCQSKARGECADQSDGQLLTSFVERGDRSSLELLVYRHGPMVMGACRRLLRDRQDIEDAFQATFLTLLRKASSIVKREGVAAWLHSVACKTAARMRDMAAKRRRIENQVVPMPEPAIMDQQKWRELQAILDAELDQLPERFREAFILCCMEGQSVRGASRQLHCSEPTVAGRLAKARSLLSKRLARRGILMSATAWSVLAQNATASLPTQLVSGTVEAATLLVSGHMAGLATTNSVVVMNAVVRGMFLAKLKLAGTVLVLALLGAAVAHGTVNVFFFEETLARPKEPAILPNLPVGVRVQPDLAAGRREAPVGPAGIRLLAKTTIAGDAADPAQIEEDGLPGDWFGSISGLAYTGRDDLYVLVSGASKGSAANELCRFHTVKISVNGQALTTSVEGTTILRDETGRPFVGLGGDLTEPGKFAGRLDPTGVCVSSRDTYYVSENYGPSVGEFDRQGKRIKRFQVPSRFQTRWPQAGVPAAPKVGSLPKRGLHGLALTPDGTKLLASMHGSLVQDGGRKGANVRILEIDVASGQTREFLYPLHERKANLSEILAISNHEFLVLERGHEHSCKVFKIDLAGATDIQHLDKLAAKTVPEGVKPLTCTPFLDLYDRKFGQAKGRVPNKLESLSFGPDLADGSRLLLMASSNDALPERPTYLFAFAVNPVTLR